MRTQISPFYMGALLLAFTACTSNDTTVDTTTENTNETTENTTEAEETLISEAHIFEGVEKGNHLLYGHSEIEANGTEITTEEMMQQFTSNGEYEGKVAVTINEVCKKAGCWITFNNGTAEPVRVFFRDHFTIPTETASGTAAILYGKVIQDTLTVDFQKHLLDDAAAAGETVEESEYAAITEDLIETTFDCESILVQKQ